MSTSSGTIVIKVDMGSTAEVADRLNEAFARLSDASAEVALALDHLAVTVQQMKEGGLIEAVDRDDDPGVP